MNENCIPFAETVRRAEWRSCCVNVHYIEFYTFNRKTWADTWAVTFSVANRNLLIINKGQFLIVVPSTIHRITHTHTHIYCCTYVSCINRSVNFCVCEYRVLWVYWCIRVCVCIFWKWNHMYSSSCFADSHGWTSSSGELCRSSLFHATLATAETLAPNDAKSARWRRLLYPVYSTWALCFAQREEVETRRPSLYKVYGRGRHTPLI